MRVRKRKKEMRIYYSDLIAPSFADLHCDLKEGKWREVWLKGGRGSTKSTFTSVEIILGMLHDSDANAIVMRRYSNELRDTVFGQFVWSISRMGLEHRFRFQYAPMQIILEATGQKILFKGADNPRKLKSINIGKGQIKYAWLEETDQYAGMEEIRNILQSIFRGDDSARISFYSYNPPKSGRSWVNAASKILKSGRIVHHSTYETVPPAWLGETFLTEAAHLQQVNEMAYRHEYLGEEVGTGLEVFNNVQIRVITDEEITSFDQIRQGLDWGYAADPLCFIRMHYNRKKRQLYIFHEISGINLFNRVFFERAMEFSRFLTVADSSEPKSIDEVKSYGMKITGAKKGPGSVESGVKFLQDLEQIIIDPARCPRAAKEFINYALEMTRAGDIKNTFPDKDNHAIDSARYGLEDDMPKPEPSAKLPQFGHGFGSSQAGLRI